jgi:hypothetical protein
MKTEVAKVGTESKCETIHDKVVFKRRSTFFPTALALLVVFLFVMGAPSTSSAEGISSFSPAAWDYGDIALGESASQIFTLVSGGLCGGAPVTTSLTIYAIYLAVEPGGSPYEGEAFEITAYPGSYTVAAGESRDIEVTFAPPSIGSHDVYLYILSNACDGNAEITPLLEGIGVPDEGDPTELMADLLDFFDVSVAEGTVVGEGPGASSSGRLKAFGNMLAAADDLIAGGEFGLACQQLQDAYDRADGIQPPPDFIDGEGQASVSAMIVDVMEGLGCPSS